MKDNAEQLWSPHELTPVQEEIQISQDFQPTSFTVYSADEVAAIEIIGKNARGLTMGNLPGERGVFVEKVALNLQLIEKLNESPYTCKIIAVLETSPEDP